MTESFDNSAVIGDAGAQVPKLTATAVRPSGFEWKAIDPGPPDSSAPVVVDPVPPLGAIADFVQTWIGAGFNTIFRPHTPGADNILELNLTTETLSFSKSLGSIPNRGMVQPDTFLNGIPYLQTITDVTDPSNKTDIHLEPGVWLAVPATQQPTLGVTYARMASIPHGTTILLQGEASTAPGAPTIPAVDITPTSGGSPIRFPSQTAASPSADRIPQDLSTFIANGSITQAILDDPNTVLRNAIAGQTITQTTTITVASNPASPLFGGGAENIAFLLGDAGISAPNAHAARVDATFWIETVQNPDGSTFQQIQYTQRVELVFNGLTWPHISVATLRPLQQPGTRTFQRVASAQTSTGTQYVAIGDGQLWHTIHNADGTWQPDFRTIESQETNNPREFTSVAVAGVADVLHVVGLADGQLWHTFRNADGSWQTFFGHVDESVAGNNPGTFTAVSAFGLADGDLQVTGVSNGALWFTTRHTATRTWDPFIRIDG